MINANELRVGNYHSYYGESCQGYILGFSYSPFSEDSKICISAEGGGYTVTDIKDLTPIPLSEKILLEFDFALDNKTGERKVYSIGSFVLIVENNKFELKHTNTFIETVHHLQSLYYWLYSTELIRKN